MARTAQSAASPASAHAPRSVPLRQPQPLLLRVFRQPRPRPFYSISFAFQCADWPRGPEPPGWRRTAANRSGAHCPAPPPRSAGSWWGVVGDRGPQPRLPATPEAWGTRGGGDPQGGVQGCFCRPPYLSEAYRSAVRGSSIHAVTLVLVPARCLPGGALLRECRGAGFCRTEPQTRPRSVDLERSMGPARDSYGVPASWGPMG